ncbi:unnamed protein product [Fraxinus pennsylvanica]|uniref:AB hydrolase-1 domain-containing protein n=1 Tax=Fraxinus pennsylvanica TaxID=56036 RepID=A0AAD2E223_9LAMI|nr:unnamed protein product [Fraxinus pennsylvanica]
MGMAVNFAAPHTYLPTHSSSITLRKQYNPICSSQNLFKISSWSKFKNPISVINWSNASTASVSTEKKEELLPLGVSEINEKCKKWVWKGYTINYFVYPEGHNDSSNLPLLLIHGHFRNIPTLAQSYTVYAIDLLGFGASDKPAGFAYSMEMILDFLDEIVQRPAILMGNSVGSLACVIAAAESTRTLIRGPVLLNCARGMNNKAIVDDWRINRPLPLLWFFDFLLKRKGIASYLFDRVRQRLLRNQQKMKGLLMLLFHCNRPTQAKSSAINSKNQLTRPRVMG